MFVDKIFKKIFKDNIFLFRLFSFFSVLIITTLILSLSTDYTQASIIDELRDKIEERSNVIRQLEKEIEIYKKEVEKTQVVSKSLSDTIKTLDMSRMKLEKDISLTESKIDLTNLDLRKLEMDIKKSEDDIFDNKKVIEFSLAQMARTDSDEVIKILLSGKSVSEAWNHNEELANFQKEVKYKIEEIEDKKKSLVNLKTQTEQKKNQLVSLTKNLSSQTKSVEQTALEKKKLLTETKNQEANYKKLLQEKEAKRKAFEAELQAYESALKIAVDPNRLPASGSGVLKWPLDSVFITQYFGNTEFATKNPQVYNGRGHTGIDFRATIGTPVKSALDGVVAGTGNTDLQPGCYSYGKWVLITHNNGLSSLYAHLSTISVTQGDKVSSGEIIGLSGNTGYSTGPHLHFGVYATEGIRISKFENSKFCKDVTLPLADPKAYLNPLSYL